MSPVPNPLPENQIWLDDWSIEEKFFLAELAMASENPNWISISFEMRKKFDDRPSDWFTQKTCALQYTELLQKEEQEMPSRKRKRGSETAAQAIYRKLKAQRISELTMFAARDFELLQQFEREEEIFNNPNITKEELESLEELERQDQLKDDQEEEELKKMYRAREKRLQAASGEGDTKTYASQIGEDLNLKPDFKNLDLEFGTLEQASIPAHVDNQILPSPTTTSSMSHSEMEGSQSDHMSPEKPDLERKDSLGEQSNASQVETELEVGLETLAIEDLDIDVENGDKEEKTKEEVEEEVELEVFDQKDPTIELPKNENEKFESPISPTTDESKKNPEEISDDKMDIASGDEANLSHQDPSQAHLDNPDPKTWRKQAMTLWKDMDLHRFAMTFSQVARTVPAGENDLYNGTVLQQRDMNSIKKDIANEKVKNVSELEREVLLMLLNATMFNSSDSEISQRAITMANDCKDIIWRYKNAYLHAKTSNSS